MNTKNKKLVGGLLIGLVFTAICTVLATAQTNDATQETTTPPPVQFGGHHGLGPLAYNLTEEQRTEIEDLLTTLREQNATMNETQAAIQEKLDEFGVLDTQLDNEINQTELRLQILNREKELREQGYSWYEINTIIQEEFGLEDTMGPDFGMAFDHGFGPGPNDYGIPPELSSGEEIQQ
jgi:Spy/CpxP family protein refolding chaperone